MAGHIDDDSALGHVMAWREICDMQLPNQQLWVPQGIYKKLAMVQVRVVRRQAMTDYLCQCWPRFMSSLDVASPQYDE